MAIERAVEDIVETLKNARRRGRKATIVAGAGTSARGNVPTSADFVELIKRDYPQDYRRAHEKNFHHLMSELAVGEGRDLVESILRESKINWASVCIAQLVKEGFVDRVITANFDMLIARAMSLVGVAPSVYDLSGGELPTSDDLPDPSLIYLYGQGASYTLLTSPEDRERLHERTSGLFEDAGRNRIWLVVGYSGDGDPVFDHLSSVKRFDHRLYWAGYRDEAPSVHVCQKLLDDTKGAYLVAGHDADDLLVEVTRGLGCFPPAVLATPFTHIENQLGSIAEFTIPGQTAPTSAVADAVKLVHAAVNRYEMSVGEAPGAPNEDVLAQTTRVYGDLMRGDYDAVARVADSASGAVADELAEPASWAHLMEGLALTEQAQKAEGDDVDRLYEAATIRFADSLRVNPNRHEALYHWGNVLSELAQTRGGDEGAELLAEAGRKYEAAHGAQPDRAEILHNWGVALSELAKLNDDEAADALFVQAEDKYSRALELKPEMHEALNNWGLSLYDQALTKYGDDADVLFRRAGEKYAGALEIHPADHNALHNWGVALYEQAKTHEGDEAAALYEQAVEKYQAAIRIKPDRHETLNNLGVALYEMAELKSGREAARLFSEAERKLLQAEELAPGSSAYNLACLNALCDEEDKCLQWLETSRKLGTLPTREHLAADPDLARLREHEMFRQFLSAV